jgi:SAM-dependent methyltransferase
MATCGLDLHLTGLRYARRRIQGLLIWETATRVPFAGQFDVVALCDVIEHAPDDVAVLRQASRALRAGGVLVVTVPAYQQLWTAIDDISGHKRRYTRQALVGAMQRAGLQVRLARYFHTLLLPAQLLARQRFKRRPPSSNTDQMRLLRQALRVPPEPVNALLHLATRADAALSRLSVPFGSSLIAIGHRS